MFKSLLFRYGLLSVLLTATIAPAVARPHPIPPGPSPVHHPRNVYERQSLPDAVSFLLLSGITYAVIDGLYYREQGDKYIYVENPPVQADAPSYNIVKKSNIGQIVNVLPGDSKTVSVDGVTFYVSGSRWYAPIASSHKFVIVDPQL